MSYDLDPRVLATGLIDANAYMTLATADAGGRPWASPVWYAHHGHTEFYWVSRPEARHSRNLATRSEVGIVIFDSTITVGEGQAVYVEAAAEQLAGAEAERAIEVFSRRSETHGAGLWTIASVTAPAQLRLYRATAAAIFVLDAHDHRVAVPLGPNGAA